MLLISLEDALQVSSVQFSTLQQILEKSDEEKEHIQRIIQTLKTRTTQSGRIKIEDVH